MCESNVYLLRENREELFMEKVDRIVPGEDDNIFMENVFGERRVIRAKIKEMELVHHRILIAEIEDKVVSEELDSIWLEPLTDHGHFHPGEKVFLSLKKGRGLRSEQVPDLKDVELWLMKEGQKKVLQAEAHQDMIKIDLGEEDEGLITVIAEEHGGSRNYLAKVMVEIGHHDHHQPIPAGLPLEIVPARYNHPHLGEYYEIIVLRDGVPLPHADVYATYAGHRQPGFPVHTKTDEEGKAKVFLSARGNYLLVTKADNLISSFTVVKNY